MRKKRLRKIEAKKISKECWELDAVFLDWLRKRLPVYLKDSEKIVDLEVYTFNYKDAAWTQKALIERMIELLHSIEGKSIWDDGYIEVVDEILDIWKMVFHFMWW